MNIQLRPYQQDALKSLYDYFGKATGNPLLVLPTGAGKSVIQAAFVAEIQDIYPGERIMLLTHVKELLEQNAAKLHALIPFADVGVYSAGLRSRDTEAAITVAGIQSVYKRAHEFGRISLVIIDECHLVPKRGAGMYRQFLEDLRKLNPAVKVIGMSATPYRLDTGLVHEGDGAIFTDVAYEADVVELVGAGYLCPLISKLGATRADVEQVKVRGGEYVARDLAAVVDTTELVAGAVDEILELCADRSKWLLFCAGVGHAHHVRDELARRGIPAACVTGETPAAERDQIISDFKAGRLRAVTNMNVLTTGFDAPDIDAIIMLRPTLSTGLYVQMCGRGMRPHPSKENTLVLDFAGNILRHGPIDKIKVKPKSEGGGVSTAPMRECPSCQQLCFINARECQACGHVFEREEKPVHSTRATTASVMSGVADHIQTLEVEQVDYRRHTKPGKPPSLRVDYFVGLTHVSEWVCLEHTGFARAKAVRWWKARSDRPPPATIDEALDVVDELKVPAEIVVDDSEKFARILAHRGLHLPAGADEKDTRLAMSAGGGHVTI